MTTKQKVDPQNAEVPPMQLHGNSIETVSEMTTVPAHVIQLAIDGHLPPVVVNSIESLIIPVGRQEMRRARGDRSVEDMAMKCNLTTSLYRMIEDGLVKPHNPAYLALQVGCNIQAILGPTKNILLAKRRARGWSQEFVASSLNISQPELSRAERGMCESRIVNAILAFLNTGEPKRYEPQVDKIKYMMQKHHLTVDDITSLTGLTHSQVLNGCDELDDFFAKLES